MPANYQRYSNIDVSEYDKKGLSYLLWRCPSDKIILPAIKEIKDKKILDVGCGTGYYTKYFLRAGNEVVGIDKNLHLSKNLSMRVLEADAANFIQKIDHDFDVVFSGWLTEYLCERELEAFFKNSFKALKPGGVFLSTIISPYGWGFVYTFLARYVRGVQKHNCSKKTAWRLLENAGFGKIKIISLPSWAYVPWAYLIYAQK